MGLSRVSLSGKPNQYLAAPEGYCTVAQAHSAFPSFAVPVARLRQAFEAILAREPRIRVTRRSEDGLTLVQRSAVFHFPDDIDVSFIPLGPDRSTLALFSRSRYGHSDFGVNRRRVLRLLRALEAALS